MARATAVKIARRLDLSTRVKQWSSNMCTAVKQWRETPQWSSKNRSISTIVHHDFGEIGYTDDVADLLSTPERDFLVKNNGQKVPISSLEGKLVGLYFCDNIPHPPRMQAIKKVYEEAKSRGYDFEIVQITFHYRCNFNAKHLGIDPRVRQCREDVSWLTLPFKDPMDPMNPSYRKMQRIFERVDKDNNENWDGDSLVLIYPRQAQAEADDGSGVLFEFSGAEILERWGIEGYPFTRPSVYKAEYELQKRVVTLQWLFPPGERLLRRPRSSGHGHDLVDAFPQLTGKRVLVLFAPCPKDDPYRVFGVNFVSLLKSEYKAQVEDNVAEESKFEVVYLPESFSHELTKDMPWLVRPFSSGGDWGVLFEIFKLYGTEGAAVAFNEQGELIAKECCIGERKESDHKLRFPFIDQDLEKPIRVKAEVYLG